MGMGAPLLVKEVHMAADMFLTSNTGACAEKNAGQVVAAPAQ